MKFLIIVLFAATISLPINGMELSDPAAKWKKLCNGELIENFKSEDEAIGACTMGFAFYLIGLSSPSTPVEEHLFPCVDFGIESTAAEFVKFMDKNRKYESVPIIDVLPSFYKLNKDCGT